LVYNGLRSEKLGRQFGFVWMETQPQGSRDCNVPPTFRPEMDFQCVRSIIM
jgi:hypothetical protein